MNELILEGVVRSISESRNFEDKLGTKHIERELFVETEEPYPQTCTVRTVDAVAMQTYVPGSRVRCHLQLRAAQAKQSGRWFNVIKAWRVEML